MIGGFASDSLMMHGAKPDCVYLNYPAFGIKRHDFAPNPRQATLVAPFSAQPAALASRLFRVFDAR